MRQTEESTGTVPVGADAGATLALGPPGRGPAVVPVVPPSSAGERLEAVVVTCDSGPDLERLLDCSVVTGAFGRIVVIDNASHDRSALIAAQRGVEVVRRRTTRGFGAAVNIGAARTSGEFFAVINPDITIEDPQAIPSLLALFEDPAVAIVAPGLDLPDGSVQDSARLVPTPGDLLLRRLRAPTRGSIVAPGPVPWVTGAFVIVRRSAFVGLGGFDPRFALYFEDVDLCVRARRAGWTVLYHPQVRAQHRHVAASRKRLLASPARRHIRSAVRFYAKHPRHVLRNA